MSAGIYESMGLDESPFMPVFAAPQRMFVRGRGTELFDFDGNRYLDFLSGLAVTSLGHANPAITAAIAAQAAELMHVSNFFANPPAVAAAVAVNELLAEATANQVAAAGTAGAAAGTAGAAAGTAGAAAGTTGKVFFTNSGAESIECAIKLARKHGGRGRHTVVSAFGSFHGRTLAALAATGQPTKHEPFQPMPEGFRHVAFGDLDALRSAVDGSVAAVLIEPIQGEGGVRPAPPGYLAAIRSLCDETGALMMVDEIQTGMGRTGRWFGFEHDGVVPDVVTLAKALGNGMPVGACWARTDVASVFEPGDHGSTYSATAIATAAVNAVIAEMRRIDAPALAARQGERLASALRVLPGVTEVRGRGLLLAAATPDHDAAVLCRALLDRGLVANAVGPTSLRFAPPITVSEAEIDEAVAIVGDVLAVHCVPRPRHELPAQPGAAPSLALGRSHRRVVDP